MRSYDFKRQAWLLLLIFIICNIIPTCRGYKAEISRSLACPAFSYFPQIISFAPQVASNNESFLVKVKGCSFDKDSRLLVKGRILGKKYLELINSENLIVKVPRGIPGGKYPVAIRNPDGRISNEVYFEIRS